MLFAASNSKLETYWPKCRGIQWHINSTYRSKTGFELGWFLCSGIRIQVLHISPQCWFGPQVARQLQQLHHSGPDMAILQEKKETIFLTICFRRKNTFPRIILVSQWPLIQRYQPELSFMSISETTVPEMRWFCIHLPHPWGWRWLIPWTAVVRGKVDVWTKSELFRVAVIIGACPHLLVRCSFWCIVIDS